MASLTFPFKLNSSISHPHPPPSSSFPILLSFTSPLLTRLPASNSSSLSYRNGYSGFKSAHYPTVPANVSLVHTAEKSIVKPAMAPYNECPGIISSSSLKFSLDKCRDLPRLVKSEPSRLWQVPVQPLD